MIRDPESATRGIALLLLSAILMIWPPWTFSAEVAATLPSIGIRGLAAVIELLFHGAVAALAAAGGFALWTGRPHGPGLASAALIASAVVSVQSLYVSVLPSQTVPGDKLPLAILSIGHAGGWLVYLRRSDRIRQMAS